MNDDQDTGTLVRIIGNFPPEVVDHAYQTDEDVPLVVSAANGFLNGASDPEGDPLTASVHFTDESGPYYGEVDDNADGSFEYTPTEDFHGEDSFLYVASDGHAESEPGLVTVTISPVNDAPVAQDYLFEAESGSQISANLLTDDSDVDDARETLIVRVVDAPEDEQGLDLNPDGSFTYQHDDTLESDSFTYEIEDPGEKVSQPGTVTFNFLVEQVSTRSNWSTPRDRPEG